MSLHYTPAKKSSGQKTKNRKTPTAYLQTNSGQLLEAVQRSDADRYMKGYFDMNYEYRKAIDKLCRHTYIEPFYKDEKLVKLEFKGEKLTDYITLEQAYILVKAFLRSDEINAELEDF